MRRARGDPLGGALRRAVAACGGVGPIEEVAARAWASATFVGAVHRLAIEMEGVDAADRLATTLETHEFAINGHIVADVATIRTAQADGRVRLEIEILTVEE